MTRASKIIRKAELEIDNYLKGDKFYNDLLAKDSERAAYFRFGMISMNLANQIKI